MSLHLASANNPRPFDDDWHACLCAHYIHVIREVAAGGAPQGNADNLRRVLIERAGFAQTEIDALYRQALGIISGYLVEVTDETAVLAGGTALGVSDVETPAAVPETVLSLAVPALNIDAAPPDLIDVDALLATLSEDDLLRDINEGEDAAMPAVVEAYSDGDATLGDVVAQIDPEAEAPTTPDQTPEASMPPVREVKQLALF
ncbi:MAG: hypothetical protein SGI73_21970 [Chloroflexota bacterium]|nr:hypothetical protein [Chloroflexota bacterium]